MNCVYTYNGRDYSYAEFAAALHEGLLEDLSAKGEVVLDVEIPKIETNAVQEPSTTGVDVRQQARDGEAVGEGNAQKEEVAEAQEEKEVVEEKPKQVKERFYKHVEGKGYVEVKKAKPTYLFGTEKAFYTKEGGEYIVSDALTGAEIGRSKNASQAIANAEQNAGSAENLQNARERFYEAYGQSPYAKLQQELTFTQSLVNDAIGIGDETDMEQLEDKGIIKKQCE